MAAPWVSAMTRVSDGTNSQYVFDYNYDLIQANTFDGSSHVPIGNRPHDTPGALWSAASMKSLVAGSGTAGTPPDVDLWLKACALKYQNAPATSDTYSVTGDLKTDFTAGTVETALGNGILQTCTSAAGNLIVRLEAGQPAIYEFTMDGVYAAASEAALADAFATRANPQSCVGLTITMDTETLVLKDCTFNLNNENDSPNLDIAGTNGTSACNVTNQKPTMEFTAYLPAFATANYWTDYTAQNQLSFSGVLGTVAGNILTITGDFYMTAEPEILDLNGMVAVRVTTRMGEAAADTALTMVYT